MDGLKNDNLLFGCPAVAVECGLGTNKQQGHLQEFLYEGECEYLSAVGSLSPSLLCNSPWIGHVLVYEILVAS